MLKIFSDFWIIPTRAGNFDHRESRKPSLEAFKQSRVSNLQYRVWTIFFSNGFRDSFCLFFRGNGRFLRPKTHIFGRLGTPDSAPTKLGTIRQKIP